MSVPDRLQVYPIAVREVTLAKAHSGPVKRPLWFSIDVLWQPWSDPINFKVSGIELHQLRWVFFSSSFSCVITFSSCIPLCHLHYKTTRFQGSLKQFECTTMVCCAGALMYLVFFFQLKLVLHFNKIVIHTLLFQSLFSLQPRRTCIRSVCWIQINCHFIFTFWLLLSFQHTLGLFTKSLDLKFIFKR